MKWSPQQDAALKACDQWLRAADRPIFRIFGYAGTGKTTLARHFADDLDGNVAYAAFTGKAAMVMRKNGCADASTIHGLIYNTEENGRTGRIEFILKEDDKTLSNLDLIIIDECSMVDEEIGNDLLSFDIPILVLGDPAQLPPVKGGGFFTDHEPDAMLTEIHRQAKDNPIIHLATEVREGRDLTLGKYGASRVIRLGDIDGDQVIGVEQVLVGKNITRTRYNRRMRQIMDRRDPLPVPGDRLVCLKNDRPLHLFNGGLWTVDKLIPEKTGHIQDHCISLSILSEDFAGTRAVDVSVRREFFTGGGGEIPWKQLRGTQQFDYGYALTVHKSQGSQWSEVMLFDESAAFREASRRWLYTGITRAAEKLTIVM